VTHELRKVGVSIPAIDPARVFVPSTADPSAAAIRLTSYVHLFSIYSETSHRAFLTRRFHE